MPVSDGHVAVYPRPRGGTLPAAISHSHSTGLSPPTRGNHPRAANSKRRDRSIPAHAGEPEGGRRQEPPTPVYPRPRGGTVGATRIFYRVKGLSPPTRGNLILPLHGAGSNRSIPAHAGEPTPGRISCRRVEVYPRPRGGTDGASRRGYSVSGLSPPTRGNPSNCSSRTPRWRSIPAHAGEPR